MVIRKNTQEMLYFMDFWKGFKAEKNVSGNPIRCIDDFQIQSLHLLLKSAWARGDTAQLMNRAKEVLCQPDSPHITLKVFSLRCVIKQRLIQETQHMCDKMETIPSLCWCHNSLWQDSGTKQSSGQAPGWD